MVLTLALIPAFSPGEKENRPPASGNVARREMEGTSSSKRKTDDGDSLSLAGTIQMDWVAQPTWLCSAATCRRVWSVARTHRSVLPDSGGLVARQHGQVARATLIFTESFRWG